MRKEKKWMRVLCAVLLLTFSVPVHAEETETKDLFTCADVEQEQLVRGGKGTFRFRFVDEEKNPMAGKLYSTDEGVTYKTSDEDGYSEIYDEVPQVKVRTKRYYYNNGDTTPPDELLLEEVYPEYLRLEADGTDDSEYRFGDYLEIITEVQITSKTVLTKGDAVRLTFEFHERLMGLECGRLYCEVGPCECVPAYETEIVGTDEEGNPNYVVYVICDDSGIAQNSGETAGIPGDTDGNGRVEVEDARLALCAALKLKELDEEAFRRADVVTDERITLEDAQNILRIALKIE